MEKYLEITRKITEKKISLNNSYNNNNGRNKFLFHDEKVCSECYWRDCSGCHRIWGGLDAKAAIIWRRRLWSSLHRKTVSVV